ncbi:hypothetical protein [Sphingomonas sp.]|uniref:hypothetical protein n=1 Tax=Sphingomonas sp. TaxID=28214 RepID=UPI003D6D7734
MLLDDREYHEQRAQAETIRAHSAVDPSVARVHLTLAKMHEERATGMSITDVRSGEMKQPIAAL